MTLEQAVEWCMNHAASVSWESVAETYDGRTIVGMVRVEVRNPDGSQVAATSRDFEGAVRGAAAAFDALRAETR